MAASSTLTRHLTQMSPEEALDVRVGEIKEIMMRLVSQNEGFRKREVDLNTRLQDALEKVYELETKCRGKDQLIEELQEMNRTRRSR